MLLAIQLILFVLCMAVLVFFSSAETALTSRSFLT